MLLDVAALLLAFFALYRAWDTPSLATNMQNAGRRGRAEREKLQEELELLRQQLQELREEVAAVLAGPSGGAAPVAAPPLAAFVAVPGGLATPELVVRPAPASPAASAAPAPEAPRAPAANEAIEPVAELTPTPLLAEVELPARPAEATLEEAVAPVLPATPVTAEAAAPPTALEAFIAEMQALAPPAATAPPAPAAIQESALASALAELPPPPTAPGQLAPPTPETTPELPQPLTELTSEQAVFPDELVAEPVGSEPPLLEPDQPNEPVAAPAPPTAPDRTTPPPPVARRPQPARPAPRVPRPAPVRTGPNWWERASALLLENWTGILGAVVLVTGVGFLGVYAALRLAPPFRFLMICGFAAGLLGARYALREKPFARQLNAWLLSSAAAIFLFACVGAVSIAGLRWATPPFDYLLLLAGVSANLGLAWRSSRQEVATLHGVLSLVALAVLPPTALTLGAAAGVTAFSIAITYRQLWKYQLLLSIASFFVFHLYWYRELPGGASGGLRLAAMGLVTAVGAAAAVVQYRRVYAKRQFEPLLFAAHLLNWTCLAINLYLYSTGSVWKTIPLALGALLTFWTGRQAKRLGIGWLFQTDTILSLILALATSLSLQGWHATPTVIALFMLLESLLVALIMARQSEALVYRVAMTGALLAGVGLLGLAGSRATAGLPPVLYRDALVLTLAGWAGLAFVQALFRQPLLAAPGAQRKPETTGLHLFLLNGFAGLAGLLQLGAALGLARVLFGYGQPPVGLALLGLAGAALGLAAWLRAGGATPDWVRQQQVALAQGCLVLAGLGLHEAGLTWAGVWLVVFAESLVAAGLLARRGTDYLLYLGTLGGGALAGVGLLLAAAGHLEASQPPVLYRDALLLALAAGLGLAFGQWSGRQRLTAAAASHADAPGWPPLAVLGGLAGLMGALQVGAGVALGWVLFGWSRPLAIVPLLALAGGALALGTWVRAARLLPDWVRRQQFVLSQLLVVLAIFGLHETNLNWPALVLVLLAENLAVALVLAQRSNDRLLHGGALTGALLAGGGLLLVVLSHLAGGQPPVLYRDALLLTLAGWGALAFVQLSFRQRRVRQLAAGTAEVVPQASLLGLLGALAGLLQAGAGLVLAWVLFRWSTPLLGLPILGLAGAALGLAAWLRTAGWAPDWLRQQQLGLGQALIILVIFGLHEAGLVWPAVLLLLVVESLLATYWLARRPADYLLHGATLAGGLLAAAGLLGLAAAHLDAGRPLTLYREAGALALAGWAAVVFGQVSLRQLLALANATDVESPDLPAWPRPGLLSSVAGLGGLLQAAAGGLLARVLFGWAQPGPLLALPVLAGAALGLAAWVRASGLLPGGVRQLQLVLAQGFLMLAVLGLHTLGLSWPGALLALYAECIVAALLLAGRGEDALLRAQTYLLLVLALALPLLVYYASSQVLTPTGRAGLLVGAALLTVGYQLRRTYWPRAQVEIATVRLGAEYRLPLLGLAVGWLLLGAGALVYAHTWAGWAAVGLLGALLLLRQRGAVPGLWAGLVLVGTGYLALQWRYALAPSGLSALGSRTVLLYLLPTLAVPLAALPTAWWPAAGRFVRKPWLYLLGAHLVVALLAATPPGHVAYLLLGGLALAATAFGAALAWRRTLPDAEAVARAGQPDRALLHLSYAALLASLLAHTWLLFHPETLLGQPADYLTAGGLFAVLVALAAARPPATEPRYTSWRLLQPGLPEAALLFGSITLVINLLNTWLPLVWIGSALVLSLAAPRLPARFRRLGQYAHLYYGLAAAWASVASVRYLTPQVLLGPAWWALAAAVALLFAYVALALRQEEDARTGPAAPGWLAGLGRTQFEAGLLYPAFVTLALFFVQSFDRSVLTVLLMLEVLAVFSASLLLRRQDLRYVALAGMLACMVRLGLHDLKQHGSITRAIVFIFTGLLLLGMNALYARFKTRFAGDELPADENDAPEPDPEDEHPHWVPPVG